MIYIECIDDTLWVKTHAFEGFIEPDGRALHATDYNLRRAVNYDNILKIRNIIRIYTMSAYIALSDFNVPPRLVVSLLGGALRREGHLTSKERRELAYIYRHIEVGDIPRFLMDKKYLLGHLITPRCYTEYFKGCTPERNIRVDIVHKYQVVE